MKIAVVILSLTLCGCAINGHREAYMQTPKVSVPIWNTGATVWGYGVIGVSLTRPEITPK